MNYLHICIHVAAQRPMMIPQNAGVIPLFAPQQAPGDMNIGTRT
jgi:hypothetical protein